MKYIKASIETILFNEAEKESTVPLEERLNNCKLSDLWSQLWSDVVVDDPPLDTDTEELERLEEEWRSEEVETQDVDNKQKEDTDEEVEEMIRSIMETLPHLGDGKFLFFGVYCVRDFVFYLFMQMYCIMEFFTQLNIFVL